MDGASSGSASRHTADWPVFLALVAALGTLEGALDVHDIGGEAVFARAPGLLLYATLSWLLPAVIALGAAAPLSALLRAATRARALRNSSVAWALFVALVLVADAGWGTLGWWGALLFGLVGAASWQRFTPRVLAMLPRVAPVLLLVLALLTPWVLGSAWHPGEVRAPRGTRALGEHAPNVLLIVADALRADALGCYRRAESDSTSRTSGDRVPEEGGSEDPAPGARSVDSDTPVLDALAAESWRVPDVLATSSWTLPSVASLLTGSSPRVHGVRDFDGRLPAQLPTLTSVLRRAGYATGAVLGNPILDRQRGFERDMRHVRGDTHRPEASFYWIVRLNRWAVRLGLLRGPHAGSKLVIPILDAQGLRARRTGVMMADEVVDAGLELLDGFGDAPFFLYLHAFDPHDPYLPHPSGVLRDEPDFAPENVQALRALYAGEVRFLDAQIGRLFDELRRREQWRDTLVVFTADHGEEFLDHGGYLHRASLHDELVRLPLIVRFPAGVQAGHAPAQASLVDVAPTILGALGLGHLEHAQGLDLRAQPPAELRVAERIQSGHWLAALRTEREHWIFDHPGASGGPPPTLDELLAGDGTRAGEQAEALGALRLRVFDVLEDPAQRRDLAAERSGQRAAMLAALRAYFADSEGASAGELSEEALQTLRSLGYLK
ncbi:MAG: hypothetical protein DHS20C15_29600 [Planctomycetota bacterium]|nr:MAG: hypothetical protein DHS20C15_29600 [Planctomycetota bacterium]